ncbi:MAG: hypothetical protein Q8R76_01220 [Candidatus Omnitrophota bacterium]|nr:hypothetical protein [Candidatus Omnitrophota bacterium]
MKNIGIWIVVILVVAIAGIASIEAMTNNDSAGDKIEDLYDDAKDNISDAAEDTKDSVESVVD